MHAPPLANNLDPCLWGCHCGSLSGHHAATAFHAAKQTKPASPSQDGHQPTLTSVQPFLDARAKVLNGALSIFRHCYLCIRHANDDQVLLAAA